MNDVMDKSKKNFILGKVRRMSELPKNEMFFWDIDGSCQNHVVVSG